MLVLKQQQTEPRNRQEQDTWAGYQDLHLKDELEELKA